MVRNEEFSIQFQNTPKTSEEEGEKEEKTLCPKISILPYILLYSKLFKF